MVLEVRFTGLSLNSPQEWQPLGGWTLKLSRGPKSEQSEKDTGDPQTATEACRQSGKVALPCCPPPDHTATTRGGGWVIRQGHGQLRHDCFFLLKSETICFFQEKYWICPWSAQSYILQRENSSEL